MTGATRGSLLRSVTARATARADEIGVEGQPEPDGTGKHAGLHARAGQEMELGVGMAESRSPYQKAPPSTMLEETGPLRKSAYSRPAHAIQCGFWYWSKLHGPFSS